MAIKIGCQKTNSCYFSIVEILKFLRGPRTFSTNGFISLANNSIDFKSIWQLEPPTGPTTPANGFAPDDAHEAVADVEATIHIARIIKERAPNVWERLMGACRKADAVRIATSEEPYALTEFYYGREYTFPVAHCGSNPNYDAQVGAFDPRNDPAADLSPRWWKNNFPDDDVMAGRAEAICADTDFRRRVGQAMASRFTDREPAEHLEQRIYDGFPNRADQSLMDQFHRTDWQGRRKIAEHLSDQRVREYARRLIYMEAPEILSDGARAEMDAWIRDRVLNEDTKVPWNTIPKTMRENDELLAKATDNEAALLTDVRRFLTEMADST